MDLGATSDAAPADGATRSDVPAGPCVPDRAQWDHQVRGLVQRQCGTCHGATPEYGAPYSLLDYDYDVAGDVGIRPVDLMAHNLMIGRMPPAGTPGPTDDVRNTLVQWATCGAQTAPTGVGLRASAGVFRSPETAPAEWSHFDLTTGGFDVGPDVADLYQCFVFQAPVTEDRFIRRFEIQLDASAVVHHVVLLRDPDRSAPNMPYRCYNMPSGSQYAFAWAPGNSAIQFPDGGLRVHPGEQYVMQVHYNNGAHLAGVRDNTGVRIFHTAPAGTEWGMVAMGPLGFSLPPRSVSSAQSACTPPMGTRLLTGMPHMHQLGATFDETVLHADGTSSPLISLQGWDFGSQLFYDTPVTFAPGDRIVTRCGWNNTTSSTVLSGVRTSDEMCFNFAYVTPVPPDRFCDEAVSLAGDVTYAPSTCAPPGSSSTFPLVTNPVEIGTPPALDGGVIPAAHWHLAGIDYWLDTDHTPLGVISHDLTNLRGRGQAWTTSGGITLDLQSVINVAITTGARFSQNISIQFRSSFTPGATSPLALTTQCMASGSQVPSTIEYSVHGDQLVAGLPAQHISGITITPRYIFQQD